MNNLRNNYLNYSTYKIFLLQFTIHNIAAMIYRLVIYRNHDYDMKIEHYR